MVFLIDAHNRSSHLEELAQMHRQRKTIFVDRAGWRIPVAGDMEADAYDREDTRYLIAKEDATDGPVLASARLLSTVRSHLMSDLFLHACDGRAPRGPSVWEVSRFCVSADVLGRRRRLALLWEMTCAVIEAAISFRVERVTFVANRALAPLMLECGWNAMRLGPTLRDGADEITAIAADVSRDALQIIRQRFGVPSGVLHLSSEALRCAA